MQTADILRACFPGAHVYRMSGDEFVVVCPGVTQARFEAMLAKARGRLSKETDYGVSLGGAWRACVRENFDELVRAADESMYADKQEPVSYTHLFPQTAQIVLPEADAFAHDGQAFLFGIAGGRKVVDVEPVSYTHLPASFSTPMDAPLPCTTITS